PIVRGESFRLKAVSGPDHGECNQNDRHRPHKGLRTTNAEASETPARFALATTETSTYIAPIIGNTSTPENLEDNAAPTVRPVKMRDRPDLSSIQVAQQPHALRIHREISTSFVTYREWAMIVGSKQNSKTANSAAFTPKYARVRTAI